MELVPKPNKRHVSRSLERHVMASRDHTWSVLLTEIDQRGDESSAETVLSLEPPWRRCSGLEGSPTGLYEGTFVLRDDGPECHLSWGVVIDPDPSTAGLEFLESTIADMGRFLDRVVIAAESG